MAELEKKFKEKLKLSDDDYYEYSESEDDFHDLNDDIQNMKGCSTFESYDFSKPENKKDSPSNKLDNNIIESVLPPIKCELPKNNVESDERNSEESLLKQRKKEEELLSPEETQIIKYPALQKLKIQAGECRNEGNGWFSDKNYPEAIRCYTQALKLCPLIYPRERAIFYSNRAACFLQENKYPEAIQDCTNAIEADPSFVKAIVRRGKAFEASDKPEEALKDYQRILEIDRGNGPALEACIRLPSQIQERNENMKREMFGKLKDLGNVVLKPFGLSTDNFKVNKDPNTGSYSINFQQQK